MSLPEVASREEWLAARKALLEEEKELTRQRDASMPGAAGCRWSRSTRRTSSRAPMARCRCSTCSRAGASWIMYHFMFDPSWDEGCPSCTAGVDEVSDGFLQHLARVTPRSRWSPARRTRRSPPTASSAAGPSRSSRRSAATSTTTSTSPSTSRRRRWSINYRTRPGSRGRQDPHFLEWISRSRPRAQLLPARRRPVFHTYSAFARGTEIAAAPTTCSTMTALGRQEDWEEPKGRAEIPHDASRTSPSRPPSDGRLPQRLQQLRLGVHAESLKNGRQVVPDRALADEHLGGDGRHSLPLQKPAHHLPLPGGQAAQLPERRE